MTKGIAEKHYVVPPHSGASGYCVYTPRGGLAAVCPSRVKANRVTKALNGLAQADLNRKTARGGKGSSWLRLVQPVTQDLQNNGA